MSQQLVDRLFHELESIPLIDPHTHINPHAPASKTLADIMGYHYYTELAHSAGMPRARSKEPGLDPKEKVRRLVEWLGPLENTVQVSWLLEMCCAFFDFHEERITARQLGDALRRGRQRKWPRPIGRRRSSRKAGSSRCFSRTTSTIRSTGFDTSRYVPCLRTDDLVFHLAKPAVRQRLAKATGIEAGHGAPARRGDRQALRPLHQTRRPGLRDFAAARFRAVADRADHAVDPILKQSAHRREPSADELANAVAIRLLDAGRTLCRAALAV